MGNAIFVLCLCLISIVWGLPVDSMGDSEVVVKRFISVHNGDSYSMTYVLSDGQFRYESGRMQIRGDGEEPVWTITGMYGYTSPEGKMISYRYKADDTGYTQEWLPQGIQALYAAGKRIAPKALLSLVG